MKLGSSRYFLFSFYLFLLGKWKYQKFRIRYPTRLVGRELSGGSRSKVKRQSHSRFQRTLHSAAYSKQITMSSSYDNQTKSPVKELNDESDFETVVSPDGLISICGFGSLLSGMYTVNLFSITIVDWSSLWMRLVFFE